jgi:hypothetical protein
MSDYSFMRSGFSGETSSPFDGFSQEDIQVLLSLFVSNSMINAAKYSKICSRNGVTKTDDEYGLKYEVFEFFQREDLMEGFEEIKRDLEEALDKEEENLKYGIEFTDNRIGSREELEEVFDTIEEAEKWVTENESDYITEIEIFETEPDFMEDNIVADEDVEDFSRIELSQVEVDDRNFVQKLHRYSDNWNTWVPETPLQGILKNGVDQINKSGL